MQRSELCSGRPGQQHDRIDINGRKHVVNCHAPTAGQRLALAHRPGFEDIEEAERNKDRQRHEPVARGEERRKRGQRPGVRGLDRHPAKEAKGHCDNLIQDDTPGVCPPEGLFGGAAEPDGEGNGGEVARDGDLVHGIDDPVVPLEAAEKAREELAKIGASVQYRALKMAHEVKEEAIAIFKEFIVKEVING